MSATPASATPLSRISVAPTAFQQACNGLGLQLDFINRSSTGHSASIAVRNFGPTVRVGWVEGTPSSLSRRRAHLADGSDTLSFIISGGGRFEVDGVRGLDRGAAHGAIVLDSARTSSIHSLDHGSAWNIRIDRAPLEPLLAGIQDPLQRCLPGDNPGIRLLEGYLTSLFSLERDCDLTLAALHIRDLALCALGVRGDTQALVRERGVQAARQSAILNAIVARASEPDLDPATVAAQLGMSPRYLHRLLEPTGRSFAQHLLQRRLDCAAAMLRNPDCARLKIGQIALRAGFADISHFNRSFRGAFGDTPLGVRVRSARQLAQANQAAHAAPLQAAGQARVGLA